MNIEILPASFNEVEKSIIERVWRLNAEVLEKYHSEEKTVSNKKDGSPVTSVDLYAHEQLTDFIASADATYPIISEESFPDGPELPSSLGEDFWLIDPIDGTKGFINRNGQFAICVALVKGLKPELGIVGVPTEKSIYFAKKGQGAFKFTKKNGVESLPSKHHDPGFVQILMSKTSTQFDEDELERHRIKIYRISSAVKFCYLAEGGFDAYIRKGPTYEWDTAAGHCLAEESGAKFNSLDGSEFTYGKEKFLNGPFLVTRQSDDIHNLDKIMREAIIN